MNDTRWDSPPPLLVRDRDGCIVAARPAPTPDAEWLASHGQRIIAEIEATGFDLALALRRLLTVATGRPLSDPPRWCETGCVRAEDGRCALLKHPLHSDSDPERWALITRQQRWSNDHVWISRQPRDGILYDCPAYQPGDEIPILDPDNDLADLQASFEAAVLFKQARKRAHREEINSMEARIYALEERVAALEGAR